jgi:hypothetical protein
MTAALTDSTSPIGSTQILALELQVATLGPRLFLVSGINFAGCSASSFRGETSNFVCYCWAIMIYCWSHLGKTSSEESSSSEC